MDTVTKTLLIEVARAVLRALGEPDSGNLPANAPVPTPWATTTNAVADRTTRTQNAPAVSPTAPVANTQTMQTKTDAPQRGATVRVWTGDRYEVGVVDAVCRDKVFCVVRIRKGDGRRDKLVKSHREKLVVL